MRSDSLQVEYSIDHGPECDNAWFSIEGTSHRKLAAHASDRVIVNTRLSAGTTPGDYTFRLHVRDAAMPDARSDTSPSVVFTVTSAFAKASTAQQEALIRAAEAKQSLWSRLWGVFGGKNSATDVQTDSSVLHESDTGRTVAAATDNAADKDNDTEQSTGLRDSRDHPSKNRPGGESDKVLANTASEVGLQQMSFFIKACLGLFIVLVIVALSINLKNVFGSQAKTTATSTQSCGLTPGSLAAEFSQCFSAVKLDDNGNSVNNGKGFFESLGELLTCSGDPLTAEQEREKLENYCECQKNNGVDDDALCTEE